jgi:hypothetical protein
MAANALHSQRFSAAFHHGPPGLLAFVFTTDDGPINKLIWQTAPARVEADGTLAQVCPSPQEARTGRPQDRSHHG